MKRPYKRKDSAHTDQNLITTVDLCDMFFVSRTKLRNAMSVPGINAPIAKKIGKKYLYNKTEMLEWCKKIDIRNNHFAFFYARIPGGIKTTYQYQSTPFNAKAKAFLQTKPTVEIKPKPEKKPVKRETVHLDEINQIETPCGSMMPYYYRDNGNNNLNLPGYI